MLNYSIKSNEENKCTGCEACRIVCSQNAISFLINNRGFKYPIVDSNKCINCGKCYRVCQMNSSSSLNTPLIILGAKAKNVEEQKSSTSGGAFSVLAREILYNGGIVYGAGFVDHFKVQHIRITNVDELVKLKGSKYVQSAINDIYNDVIHDLSQNKTVLFSGTPCQINGLKILISKTTNVNDTNLYLCDIICHGVPSPGMFENYIKYNEKKYHSPIVEYSFRNKIDFDWGKGREYVKFQNGKTIKQPDPWGLDFYMMVYRHELIRSSCFSCQYACNKRVGDITIGDFWGIKNHHKDFFDKNGVSLLMINTLKGEKLINLYNNKFILFETQFDKCKQDNLLHPSFIKIETPLYWNTYELKGYDGLVELDKPSKLIVLKYNVKKILRKYIIERNKHTI